MRCSSRARGAKAHGVVQGVVSESRRGCEQRNEEGLSEHGVRLNDAGNRCWREREPTTSEL